MGEIIISESDIEELRKISKELTSKNIPHIFLSETDPETLKNIANSIRPNKPELVSI